MSIPVNAVSWLIKQGSLTREDWIRLINLRITNILLYLDKMTLETLGQSVVLSGTNHRGNNYIHTLDDDRPKLEHDVIFTLDQDRNGKIMSQGIWFMKDVILLGEFDQLKPSAPREIRMHCLGIERRTHSIVFVELYGLREYGHFLHSHTTHRDTIKRVKIMTNVSLDTILEIAKFDPYEVWLFLSNVVNDFVKKRQVLLDEAMALYKVFEFDDKVLCMHIAQSLMNSHDGPQGQ